MAGFGGLTSGGRGFGSSFPMRGGGAPNSQVVDALPFDSRAAWQDDWQRRRSEAENASKGIIPYQPGAPALQDSGGPTMWGGGDGRPAYSEPTAITSFMNDAPLGISYQPGGAFPSSTGPTFGSGGPGAATPDSTRDAFSGDVLRTTGVGASFGSPTDLPMFDPAAFQREFDAMSGRYDAFDRNTQAYDSMRGAGQINGLLSPGASGGRGSLALPEGTDMSWADGVYAPEGTYTARPTSSRGWSAW